MKTYTYTLDRKSYLTVFEEVEKWNKNIIYNDGEIIDLKWEDHKDFEGYGKVSFSLNAERALFWIGYLSGLSKIQKIKGL